MKGEEVLGTAGIGRAEGDGRRWEFVCEGGTEQWGNEVWMGEEMAVEGEIWRDL